MKNILLLISSTLILSACVPTILGGGTVVGTAAVSEKGITGTFTDTQIATLLRTKFYNQDPQLYYKVGIEVNAGEVLLTGAVSTETMHVDAIRLTWEVKGVKRVIDNLSVSQGANVGTFANDSWLTTKIKSSLLFDKEIPSVNYSVTTVGSVVYLMGIAQNEAEHKRVTETIRNTDGVQKVVSYVHVKDSAGEGQNKTTKETPAGDETAEYPAAS